MPVTTNSKLDKNSVFFRFAHEGNVLEKVEFYGKEIAIGDLRHAISEKKKLPKVDLQILNEATGEVYSRDGQLLQRNIIVTVRRTPIQTQKKPAVLNVEGKDIWSKVPKAPLPPKKEQPPPPPEQKTPCPAEYLCPLCRGIFDSPSIARCCGRSACRSCFEERSSGACPLCSRQWSDELKPIPNPRLADIVGSLNLDFFELPAITVQRQAAAAQKGKTPTGGQTASPAVGGAAVASPLAPVAASPALPASLPPPPAGMTLVPCMLSPEQFHAWQQSLLSSKADRDRRRRRRRSSGSSDADKPKKRGKRRA
eukprot:TRINITY_DN77776_c0_g1_i1.p1 TRINITY_DN77776_c0_g1~~TRINITY_DN77776_c0_g1_i1.p1  ORF type:complete len:310 (-),score=67.61 TRINITY_DN77776_c0_g1_i1:8-937(-)